tara:strand:+ start:6398 stop:6817 length:420 start_codon:yes stop_codon:yes gene_type:complete
MLKEMGLTDEHLEGALKEQPCDILDGRTPRWAMQTLGTEWGRDLISKNLWGTVWEHAAKRLLPTHPVVTDDCRFQNEAERVRRMGGMIIRLSVKGQPSTGTGEVHSSEGLTCDVDVEVNNTLDERLFRTLDFLARGHIK